MKKSKEIVHDWISLSRLRRKLEKYVSSNLPVFVSINSDGKLVSSTSLSSILKPPASLFARLMFEELSQGKTLKVKVAVFQPHRSPERDTIIIYEEFSSLKAALNFIDQIFLKLTSEKELNSL